MKLWGFSTLQLGSIEVTPTITGVQLQQKLAVCSCCEYCCPLMRLADCGHVFCQRCLVELATVDDDSTALCTICRKVVATMEVPIQEKFVAQLRCSCPACDVVLKVCELRDHFTRCVTDADGACSLIVRIPPISNGNCSLTELTRLAGPIDHQGVHEALSSAMLPWRESQDLLENRINDIEEKIRTLTRPSFPSCHTLRLIYANDMAGLGRVYRTPMVHIDGVGFYFAADTQAKNLYFWLSSLDGALAREVTTGVWRLTVRLGRTTQGSGKSVILRDLHVGQLAKFHSFFKDYDRQDVILTACVELVEG